MGQTRFVWAVENGTFLALLTHIGVFRNNLGVVKPFKCCNVYLKSKENFRATFRNFRAISLRFRIDGGKHVVPTSSPSFYPISLKNLSKTCVMITFGESKEKKGLTRLVYPETSKTFPPKVHFLPP